MEEKIAVMRQYPFLQEGTDDIPELKEVMDQLRLDDARHDSQDARNDAVVPSS